MRFSLLWIACGMAALLGADVAIAQTSVSKSIILSTSSGALQTWIVPSDWNNASNTIETIGAGGSGAAAGNAAATGGGGGAWNKSTNISLTPGASVSYEVGAGGTSVTAAYGGYTNGNAGGDTWFCSSTSNCSSINGSAIIVASKGGSGGMGAYLSATAGAGGIGTAGVGAHSNSGGAGGTVLSYPNGNCSYCSTGGSGAGGPNGPGNKGVNQGTQGLPSAGGSGDNGSGGAGGTAGQYQNGGTGGNGNEYDATHGVGGGGAGGMSYSSAGYNSGIGGTGGSYGGGGGGGFTQAGGSGTSGAGAQGIILITYTPAGSSPPTPPPAITNLQVVARTTSSVSFSWVSGGGSTATYLVAIAQGSSASSCSSGTAVSSTSYIASSLNSGTAYTISVCATDASGNVSSPVTLSATTPTSPTPPPAITNLQVVARTTSSVSFSWVSGGGSTATYLVAIAQGSSASSCSSGTAVSSTSYIASSLNSGTAYTISVCATDASGNVSSPGTQSATTPTSPTPPPAITNLQVVARTTSSVSFSWVSGGGSTATYLVAIAQGSSASSCSSGTAVSSTSYI